MKKDEILASDNILSNLFKKVRAFSLAEILITLIIISFVVAAFAPILTKRLTQNQAPAEPPAVQVVSPSESSQNEESSNTNELRQAEKRALEREQKEKERMKEKEGTSSASIGEEEQLYRLIDVVKNCRVNFDTKTLICELDDTLTNER